MTNREFVDYVVSERMQMLHSHYKRPSEAEIASAIHREDLFTQAMEPLPLNVQDAIREYYEAQLNKGADDEKFYYIRGIKDGLLLHKTLTEF